MRIIDLETINQAMNNETQFVLRCEEVFHDMVSSAASAILSAGRERRIVALTGPSGSGKTSAGGYRLGVPLLRQRGPAGQLHRPPAGRRAGGYSLVRFQDWHYRRL